MISRRGLFQGLLGLAAAPVALPLLAAPKAAPSVAQVARDPGKSVLQPALYTWKEIRGPVWIDDGHGNYTSYEPLNRPAWLQEHDRLLREAAKAATRAFEIDLFNSV